MALTSGKDLLLKLEDGTGTFVPIGGLRTKTISLSTGVIDITNADSQGWRELLPCAGVRQVNVSGAGLFVDDTAAEQARSLFFSAEQGNWEIVLPSYGTFTGRFQISNLDYAGDYRGESAFSLSLTSSGVVAFTASAGA